MTCSTCDGYQLIDADNDGVIDAPCPDCRAAVQRCLIHGRTMVNGRCTTCVGQARRATEILLARASAVAHGAAVLS